MRQWRGYIDHMGSTSTGLPSIILYRAWKKRRQWHCIPSYRPNQTIHKLGIGRTLRVEPQGATNHRTYRRPIDCHRKWQCQPVAVWATNQITNQCNLSLILICIICVPLNELFVLIFQLVRHLEGIGKSINCFDTSGLRVICGCDNEAIYLIDNA